MEELGIYGIDYRGGNVCPVGHIKRMKSCGPTLVHDGQTYASCQLPSVCLHFVTCE